MSIQEVAKQEYKERMKQRLAGAPLPLEILMQSDDKITQQQLDAINKQPNNYENRERIPEPLLVYADLYHELTGQEPTKRTFTDFVDTFWAWKDEKLQPDHIRMAWAQAQSDKGFTVGRPGALTVTAIGMKSKAKPAMPTLNTEKIEQTRAMIEERKAAETTYVPRPANVARPRIAKTGQR
jgi:hypothetical protein